MFCELPPKLRRDAPMSLGNAGHMVYRWNCVRQRESELPRPGNFLSSVNPETRGRWSTFSERGPGCMDGGRQMGRNAVGAGAALTWQVCAPDSGPATPSSSRERGRTAGVSAAGPGEEPRPPTPGASRVSHHHMGMIWGSGLQGSGGRSRLRFP